MFMRNDTKYPGFLPLLKTCQEVRQAPPPLLVWEPLPPPPSPPPPGPQVLLSTLNMFKTSFRVSHVCWATLVNSHSRLTALRVELHVLQICSLISRTTLVLVWSQVYPPRQSEEIMVKPVFRSCARASADTSTTHEMFYKQARKSQLTTQTMSKLFWHQYNTICYQFFKINSHQLLKFYLRR